MTTKRRRSSAKCGAVTASSRVPARQFVLARQRADRAAVHRERRGDAAGVEGHAARQALERDDEALARQAADDDRLRSPGRSLPPRPRSS